MAVDTKSGARPVQQGGEDSNLPPDTAILIEARIKAGERNFQVKPIANLILHDPILTIEFLQFANSVMFGGAAIHDVEAAVTRIGTKRLKGLLAALNTATSVNDTDILSGYEILRYNCRRVSIVSLIVAAVLRPTISTLARTAGLFADVGHMLALQSLGPKYLEVAKSNRRQTLGFRLEKDHKFDITKHQVKYLQSKGIPRLLLLPYDVDAEAKGSTETDLRMVVRAAMELIESFDAGKFGNYAPDKPLPTQSTLRLLKAQSSHQEKLFKAVHDYLKTVAAEEAPDGTSLLISSSEEDDSIVPESAANITVESIRIPTYPNLSVKPASREALQEFFVLCENEQDPEVLKEKSVEYLRGSGLFNRTALLRVNEDGTKIVVERVCGLDIKPGAVITAQADTSPFKLVKLEIKSANVKAATAPFGVGAYALGPVDALPGGERLALYADRQGNEVLSMDSRRVFRLALGLLMQSIRGLREPEAE